MSLAAVPLGPEPDPPFPSLAALRSAHNDLLKSQPEDDERSPSFVAEVEVFLQRGQETGALLDTPEDRWSAQSALDYWATTLYRINRKDVDPILAEFDPMLAPELEDDKCPYVGLEAFRESQSEIFFGRSRLIGEMVARLEENRLLAVLGPSGSGKSSVVLGGLVPALKKLGALPGSKDWLYLPPMVPGAEPLRSLARALLPSGVDPAAWISREIEKLEQDPQRLVRLIAERHNGPAVLVIDQFEEVFTLCEDSRASRKQAFISNLLGLLQTSTPRHRVILTVRSDYETHVARLAELQPFFENGQIRVSALNAAELRDAIERPAERIGLKFENGLVEALLDDILGEPAGLPLLQFTLLKLWEKRERNRVTFAAYRAVGGGHGALAHSADEFYNKLIKEDKTAARRILLRMVQPRDLEVTSRRILKDSLYEIGEDPGRIDRVLAKLVAARLVHLTPGETLAETQIEIAHEALIRNWGTLVDWLNDAREAINTLRHLKNSAEEWVYLGRGQGGLLDEVQLLKAERWLKSPQAADLGVDEQLLDLVRESRKAIDQAARSQRRGALLRWVALFAVVLSLIGWFVLVLHQDKVKLAERATGLQRKMDEQEARFQVETTAKLQKEKGKFKAEMDRLERQKKLLVSQAEHASEAAMNQIQQAKLETENALAAQTLAEDKKVEADQQLAEAQAQKHDAEEFVKFAEESLRFGELVLKAAEEKEKAATIEIAGIETQFRRTEEQLETVLADGGRKLPETVKGQVGDTIKLISDRLDLRRFRKSHRPVRPGTSISTLSKDALLGTICCIVKDRSSEQLYLLSRASVFDGPPGTPVAQPSPQEFGNMADERNIVAFVERVGRNKNRSGAIARLVPGVKATSRIPRLGYIEDIADKMEVKVDTKVQLVGRGGGIQTGQVLRIEEDGTIVTSIIPAPGDSGGPLLTLDRKIIGMLWGWSEQVEKSYFIPIGQVTEELGVDLMVAKKAPATPK